MADTSLNGGGRQWGGPPSTPSTETNVLIPSKLNVVQPCAGEGSSKVCLLAFCLWEDLMEEGKRWNRSLLHPLAYLRPSLSLENGVGASLPLVRVGLLRTDLRRVLAGTHSVPREQPPHSCFAEKEPGRKSPAHSVYGRSFVWQEPAPAISGAGAHHVMSSKRKEGSPPWSILLERT